MNYSYEDKFVELIGEIPNVAIQGYDKERNVIYWNKASEDIYGYSKKEALGQKLEDLIIPEFMKSDVINAHKSWCDNDLAIPSSELPLQHKNGHTVYVYSSHVMLKKASDNPEMFCVDIDLSEQKRQEKELEAKNKVLSHQSKMASMGEMLDNIAHQWRQPLSLISSTASGVKLKNEYEQIKDPYLDNALDSIIDTTKYLSQTIEDFRGFIKGTHQKIAFNLFDNLKYSLKLLDGVLKKNNIEVIVSTTMDEIEIYGYPNELIQVIINIISNSKDAFKDDINKNKKQFIFIDIKKINGKVVFKIKDNANGIPEDILDEIFELYFTTKDKSTNSGIGLYMSYQLIVGSMKGSLKVQNSEYHYEEEKFKGAEFILELPINI